jgi:hypothetical protein
MLYKEGWTGLSTATAWTPSENAVWLERVRSCVTVQ